MKGNAPSSEVTGGKCPKLSGPDEEAQKSLVVTNVDSLDRVFDAQSALKGAP